MLQFLGLSFRNLNKQTYDLQVPQKSNFKANREKAENQYNMNIVT